MNDNILVYVKHLGNLSALARNIAELSDSWLDHNATKPDKLLQLIHEYRRQAREALNGNGD
jgi:hypothetical protein